MVDYQKQLDDQEDIKVVNLDGSKVQNNQMNCAQVTEQMPIAEQNHLLKPVENLAVNF